ESKYFFHNILNLTNIYDFNQNYSLLGSVESVDSGYLDNFNRYRIGPRYRVHGLENLFLEYYFTQWTDEDEISTNQFRVTYSDKIKEFFNYEIRYATLTYTPLREYLREATLFTRFNLGESFNFIFEYVKEWEREKDRGNRVNFRLNYSF
ncbi:hypothetical protein N9N67_07665, partial [Bacteriovoracaceae bacterium]|nr:hypothetical protein [Bacteriovoracaceae bacterium]